MGKEKQGPEMFYEKGKLQSCYKNTWEGIQGDTSGKLDLETFRGTTRDDCNTYIMKTLYNHAATKNEKLNKLISSDVNKFEEDFKTNRPSYKYLSAINNAFNCICNFSEAGKKATKLGIELCEDLQKAFKNATSVSTKPDSFLYNPTVKNYMKEQSRALKISIARMKVVLVKQESINPIKKLLASSKSKKINKKEAKYLLESIHNKNAIFEEFPNSNASNCSTYLTKTEGIAKILSQILSKELKNRDKDKMETKYLENIQKACGELINVGNYQTKSPDNILSEKIKNLKKLQVAFSEASNPSEPKYTPLLNDKDMKKHMSNQAGVLAKSIKNLEKK